ncbi:MAG: type II secretion system protein [Candidatus Blackburnbacteria bacterium]|nr:type II secretion system protein [Candidatus Blackburnbacteria bacterium]
MNTKSEKLKVKSEEYKSLLPFTFHLLPVTGFTLVELLISITILGILATIGIGNYINSQVKARDAQRKANLTQIKNALELYYNDYGKYAGASVGGRIMACPSKPTATDCDWGSDVMTDENTTYLNPVPKDPKDPGLSYFYKVSSDGSKFQLFARLENSNDPDVMSGLSSTCGSQPCNFGVTSTNTNLGESI